MTGWRGGFTFTNLAERKFNLPSKPEMESENHDFEGDLTDISFLNNFGFDMDPAYQCNLKDGEWLISFREDSEYDGCNEENDLVSARITVPVFVPRPNRRNSYEGRLLEGWTRKWPHGIPM